MQNCTYLAASGVSGSSELLRIYPSVVLTMHGGWVPWAQCFTHGSRGHAELCAVNSHGHYSPGVSEGFLRKSSLAAACAQGHSSVSILLASPVLSDKSDLGIKMAFPFCTKREALLPTFPYHNIAHAKNRAFSCLSVWVTAPGEAAEQWLEALQAAGNISIFHGALTP